MPGVAFQQVLNANRRAALNSAAWSGFASYALGVVCMAALGVALRDPLPSAALAARIPRGHGAAACSVPCSSRFSIYLVPQLGAAAFIAFLIAGQMLASVAFDHFGVLGLAQRSVDAPRLLGMGLLIAGVILDRR